MIVAGEVIEVLESGKEKGFEGLEMKSSSRV